MVRSVDEGKKPCRPKNADDVKSWDTKHPGQQASRSNPTLQGLTRIVRYGWKADVDLELQAVRLRAMERVTTLAIRIAMVVLIVAMAGGSIIIIGGLIEQSAEVSYFGVRISVLALGVFTLFALLSSIRARLGAIHETLNKR